MTINVANEHVSGLTMPLCCAACGIQNPTGTFSISAMHVSNASVELVLPLCASCHEPLARLEAATSEGAILPLQVCGSACGLGALIALAMWLSDLLPFVWVKVLGVFSAVAFLAYKALEHGAVSAWPLDLRQRYETTKSCALVTNMGSHTQITFANTTFETDLIALNRTKVEL